MPTPASGRQIGRYLLFGEIASGGMATVHYGRLSGPAGFSRTVAIKRLHPHFAKDPDFVSMFLDEARLAARIRHPNVVPTLDVVSTDAEIFLVMEYVQGESLGRLFRSVRAMMTPADTRVIATIMSGVAHGLHAAHEAKNEQGEPLDIVHRDVSPQNVLVGIDGVPRVLDFGVAKAVGRLQTTREGQIKGKLSYMAPEQLHGAQVTRQTDVYAAAVVTWEALTGHRLFLGDNEAAVVTAILQKPIKAPSEVSPHVPLAFDRVVMRGLERDPALRYATARELALDLERCVGVTSASQVGEWVESLAHDELLKRASCVAEIESVSSSSSAGRPQSLPAIVDMPTTLTATSPTGEASQPASAQPEVRSDVSSIAVSPILSAAPRRAPPRLAVLAGAGSAAAVLLVVVLLLVFRSSAPASEVTSSAASLGASAFPSPPPVDPAPADSTGAAPPAAADPQESPSVPAIAASALPMAPPTAPPAARRRFYAPPTPQAAPKRAAAGVDCDPPFTIDALGHKHYKPACLQ
jgi:serine/threonine protein kinase